MTVHLLDVSVPMSEHKAVSMDELLAEARERDDETISTIHEMLKNPRRRIVIRMLSEHGQLAKGDLDRYVAAVECEKPIPQVTDAEENRARSGLSGGHLEKLSENGFISWDRDEHAVSLGPRSDEILAYMDCLEPRRSQSLAKQMRAALRTIFR